jgi:putative acetyltransferase
MAVGCAAVRFMPGEPDTAGEPYGEIKRMFVHPMSRGQGIGDRLISTLEDALRARPVPQALLETGGEQHAALRLYERAGYARRGPFGGYPNNGLSVFYGKRLG